MLQERSTWSAIGAGTDGQVNALTVDGSAIVIGGSFQSPFSTLARFDNGTWSTLPGGLEALTQRPR